jgi:hypothetical protein
MKADKTWHGRKGEAGGWWGLLETKALESS